LVRFVVDEGTIKGWCSGRFAGYFNMDTMHTTHGRAIPVAEGLKLVNPKLNVFVVSGDGDLIGIGLSHLVNAARRNTNLKVICLNNSVYAMTGGQTSPTTPRGKKTQTDPLGCPYELINIFEIVCKPYKRFYARVTPLTKDLFFSALKWGVSTENFAFIEVVFPCYENDYRRLGYKKATEAMKALSNQLEVKGEVKNLVSNQLGIVKDYE